MPEMRSVVLDGKTSWSAHDSDAWNQESKENSQESEKTFRQAEEQASRSTEGRSQPAWIGEHVA